MSNLHLSSTIFTFVAILAQPQGLKNPLHAQESKVGEIKRQGTDSLGDPLPDGVVARLGTARLRHNDYIESVAFSPDSKMIASASRSLIHLWDAATGRELRVLPGPNENAGAALTLALAFSGDGAMLAAGPCDEGNNLCVWEVATGKLIRQLKGNLGIPMAVAFLDRDKTVVSIGSEGKVNWWDIASGKMVREWDAAELWRKQKPQEESEQLWRASLSPNGKTLDLSLSGDKISRTKVIICDLPGAKKLWEKKCEAWSLSSDGQLVAISMPDQIGVYDGTTGKELKRLPLRDPKKDQERPPLPSYYLAFSPDGKRLAAAIIDHGVRLWDLQTGKVVRDFSPPLTEDMRHVALSPDGKRLLTVCGHQICLFDVATGKEIQLASGHCLNVNYLQFSEDGQQLISSSRYSVIGQPHCQEGMLWNTATWRAVTHWEMPSGRSAKLPVPCSPDYRLCVQREEEGDLFVCERASGKALRKLELNYKRILIIGRRGFFSPNNRLLVMPAPGKLWLLDVSTGKRLCELPESADMLCFAFSPNDKSIAWYDRHRTIHVFDVSNNREQWRVGNPDLHIQWGTLPEMTFSRDGRYLASWDIHDNDVHVWDMGKGKEYRFFAGKGPEHIADKKVSLAFSPDGRTLTLAGMGGEKQVQFWELATAKLRRQMSGLSSFVEALAFSPDGRLLATGSEDTTVLIRSLAGVHGRPRSHQDLESLWNRLGDLDGPKAYGTIWILAESPLLSVPFLKKRLLPVAEPDRSKVAQLITDLDHKQFEVRDKAYHQLEKLGELAEAELRKAVAKPASPEVRRRAETLLQRLEEPIGSAEQLQTLRAVEVLELIGTSDARSVLKELAEGAKEARLTQEAKASLHRLAGKVP